MLDRQSDSSIGCSCKAAVTAYTRSRRYGIGRRSQASAKQSYYDRDTSVTTAASLRDLLARGRCPLPPAFAVKLRARARKSQFRASSQLPLACTRPERQNHGIDGLAVAKHFEMNMGTCCQAGRADSANHGTSIANSVSVVLCPLSYLRTKFSAGIDKVHETPVGLKSRRTSPPTDCATIFSITM
jgi:hypothetical protein